MFNLEGLGKVAKTMFNIFLIFLQLFMVAGYTSMVASKETFKEISSSLYPDSNFLMNSQFTEILLSSPVMWGLFAVFIFSVVKEFLVKDENRKNIINAGILLGLLCFSAAVIYRLYSPVLSAG